jgi:hypothetical protein
MAPFNKITKEGYSRPEGRQVKAERELERPDEEVTVQKEASRRLAEINDGCHINAACTRYDRAK